MKEQAIWQGVLGQLELTIPSSSFSAWFTKTKLELVSDKEAVIIVPNIFVEAQLEKKFHTDIQEALKSNGFEEWCDTGLVLVHEKELSTGINQKRLLARQNVASSPQLKRTIVTSIRAIPLITLSLDRATT